MTTKKIISEVSKAFKVTIDEICSDSRLRENADARKAVVYFLRKYTAVSNNNVASEIKKNHATIIYYYRQAESLINTDIDFKIKISKVEIALGIKGNIYGNCPCCGNPLDAPLKQTNIN